jgi:DHA1 family inner membrane transport protein
MASGANIAAFNVGNALGAWLSGLALGAGFGFVSPLWVGAGITLAGLAVLAAGSALPNHRTPAAADSAFPDHRAPGAAGSPDRGESPSGSGTPARQRVARP